MTDLEITKLCAEAMGKDICGAKYLDGLHIFTGRANYHTLYDPLHDDAQSMALVKRFRLNIEAIDDGAWLVSNEENMDMHGVGVYRSAVNIELNKCICECVAKMQQAKG